MCFGLIALGPLISEAAVAETREEAFHAVSWHLKNQIVYVKLQIANINEQVSSSDGVEK